MSKSKSSSKSTKATKSDVLTKVKDAAVVKPAQTIKSKSKDLAKQVVTREGKKDKKTKKVKEPTPEPSDSSEAEDSESSESSSSDSDSEAETKRPVINGKSNGVVKSTPKQESSDDSESEADSGSDSESEPEIKAPKANGTSKKVAALPSQGKQPAPESESESDSDESDGAVEAAANGGSSEDDSSGDDSDESSEDEKPVKNGAVKAAKIAEGAKVDIASEPSKDSDDDSDSSEESDQPEETVAKPIKRKAEEEVSTNAKKPKSDTANAQGANLFIGNLSWNVDEAWLTEVFEEFGELAGVRIVTDRDSGRSKGFGYVEFVNPEDAARAHSAKAGAELDGRAMNVDFANARPDNSQKQENRRRSYGDSLGEASDTLFLGNLAFDVGQEAVTESFAPHGTILGIRLPTDRETGQPKGFGYVTFSSVDEAKAALEAMQGAYIEGRPLRIDFSSPRPQNSDSPARGRGGFGGRGGARGGRGGRGGNMSRGGFGGRGGGRGGRGASTNRGGFGDFSGKKTSFN